MSKQTQLFLRRKAFIEGSDIKSTLGQMRVLVELGKKAALIDLKERRQRLRELKKQDMQLYEHKFAEQVRARMDNEMHVREELLRQKKLENNESAEHFLAQKRLQQAMASCQELRDVMQQQNLKLVRICQEEQMVEKQRQQAQEHALEQHWKCLNDAKCLEDQENEKALQQAQQQRTQQYKQLLEQQIQQHGYRRQDQLAKQLQQRAEAEALHKEEWRKQFDNKRVITPQMRRYGLELRQEIERKQQLRLAEQEQKLQQRRQMAIAEREADAREQALALANKRANYRATMQYLDYVRHMRQIEQEKQRISDARIEQLKELDVCMKTNPQLELQRRAQKAAQCHAELQRQLCEQRVRRLREELKHRDAKIIENYFAHPEKSREQVLRERRQWRAELDEQLLMVQQERERQQQQYEADLKKAEEDAAFCSKLVAEYLKTGADYLKPHPYWKLWQQPKIYCHAMGYAKDVPTLLTVPGKTAAEETLCVCEKPAAFKCQISEAVGDSAMSSEKDIRVCV